MCMFCDMDRAVDSVVAAKHPPESEWFWSELAIIRERWNVLRHPFYVRWSAGELAPEELERYAGDYAHLVVALAAASRSAADKAHGLLGELLQDHADEEMAHVDVWRAFAEATGDPCWDDALPATRACAKVWAGDESRTLAGDLVALYAIEAPQPEIAKTKLEGLIEHYGFEPGPATAYFRIHHTRDVEHAALAGVGLQGQLADSDPFALLQQAEAVHKSYWQMLDGLEEVAG